MDKAAADELLQKDYEWIGVSKTIIFHPLYFICDVISQRKGKIKSGATCLFLKLLYNEFIRMKRHCNDDIEEEDHG